MNEQGAFSSVAVIGAGCWGTALALVLAQSGEPVVLWTVDEEQARGLQERRMNIPLLGKHEPLPDNVEVTTDMRKAVACDLILVVVPSSVMRLVAGLLKEAGLPSSTPIMSCTKGIEQGTSKRMSEILAEVLTENPIAVLSGPNHAEEVSKMRPSMTVIGCSDSWLARNIQRRISGNWFRCYTTEDTVGMELGGAIKNVFAIASGICDELGLGDNTKAALVTRGLAEMTRLGIKLGGKLETFTGLSGIGDLMVTCYSPHSRNYNAGRYLAQGYTIDEIINKLGSVAEGIPNARSIYEMGRSLDVRTPLIDTVYSIIYEGKKTEEVVPDLFTRELRPELD